MRAATRLGIALGVLAGALAAIVWSWTFTPLGRLDLQAAIVAKLASLGVDASMEMSPEARAAANDATRAMAAWAGEEAGVPFEDRAVPGPGGSIHAATLGPDWERPRRHRWWCLPEEKLPENTVRSPSNPRIKLLICRMRRVHFGSHPCHSIR